MVPESFYQLWSAKRSYSERCKKRGEEKSNEGHFGLLPQRVDAQ